MRGGDRVKVIDSPYSKILAVDDASGVILRMGRYVEVELDPPYNTHVWLFTVEELEVIE